MHRHIIFLLLLSVILPGCGIKHLIVQDGSSANDMALIKDEKVVPRDEPRSKTGNNPYEVFGQSYFPLKTADGYKERGIASWYGKKFHGRKTSSGEPYDMYRMTAAHKTLPLPTYVKVTNLDNKKKVILKVNDRGPFVGDRIIDLSYAAAVKLDMMNSGTGRVEVVALTKNSDYSAESDDDSYYLQVGSYRNQGNSEVMRDALKHAGFKKVKISRVDVNGVDHFRVEIGPLKSSKIVTDNRNRLAKLFKVQAVMVAK